MPEVSQIIVSNVTILINNYLREISNTAVIVEQVSPLQWLIKRIMIMRFRFTLCSYEKGFNAHKW